MSPLNIATRLFAASTAIQAGMSIVNDSVILNFPLLYVHCQRTIKSAIVEVTVSIQLRLLSSSFILFRNNNSRFCDHFSSSPLERSCLGLVPWGCLLSIIVVPFKVFLGPRRHAISEKVTFFEAKLEEIFFLLSLFFSLRGPVDFSSSGYCRTVYLNCNPSGDVSKEFLGRP